MLHDYIIFFINVGRKVKIGILHNIFLGFYTLANMLEVQKMM